MTVNWYTTDSQPIFHRQLKVTISTECWQIYWPNIDTHPILDMGRHVDRHDAVDRLTKCWSIYQLTYRSRFSQYIYWYVDRVSVNKSVTVSNKGWTNYTRSQLTRNVISQIAQKCTFPVINHMETRLNCVQFYTRWIPWHRKFRLHGHLSLFSVMSTLPDNPGDSRFWTVSPALQIRVWNLPDNRQSLPFLVDLTLWQWNFKYFALFEWFS